MKILYLSLKSKWYNMIELGEKNEEYREIKEYWDKRLIDKKYDAVQFSYGYTKRTMLFRLDSISIGMGKPEWGAPDDYVFVLKLGERIR